MLRVLFFSISFFIKYYALGQIWPVGRMQGIDFNGKEAKIVNTGINNDSISHRRFNESYSSAVYDCNGKFLFYTNGNDVWNKYDTIMENGRLLNSMHAGNASSTNRNVIILPIPNKNYLFYIFYTYYTSDRGPIYNNNFREYQTLYMALVDMRYNSGSGKVVFKDSMVNSNILPNPNLTYAMHSNNTDIWLVTAMNEKEILSYKIDSNGLIKSPIKSYVSTKLGTYVPYEKYNGFIKMNSNFSKLISTGIHKRINPNGHVLQYNFNRSTGSFSNEIVLIEHDEYPQRYVRDISLSPNDSFAYFNLEADYNFTGKNWVSVIQYNLFTHKKNIIYNFIRPKGSIGGPIGGSGMQLAPDNKVYIFIENKIYRINFPNKNGKLSQIKYWDSLKFMNYGNNPELIILRISGLPNNFSPRYKLFYSASTDANPCTDTTSITYLGDSSFYKLVWYFGDGDSLVQNYPNIKTGMKIKHRYQQDGFYEVRLKSYHAVCKRIKEYTDSLLIKKQPLIQSFNLSQEHGCNVDTLLLNASFKDAHQLVCQWDNLKKDTFTIYQNQLSTHQSYFNEQKQHLTFKLLSTNGCFSTFKDSFTSVFHPKPKPIILINQDTFSVLKSNNINHVFKQCEPTSYHIKDHNSSTQNLWLFNNQDSVLGTNNEFNFVNFHNNQGFSSTRQYITKSINQFNCFTQDTFFTQTYPKPIANFNLLKDSQCLRGNLFEFINQSQYNGNSDSLVFNTYWNQNHQNQTLNKKINDTGSHHFKAIVKGEFFCSDTFEQTITVLPHPESKFEIKEQQACLNNNLTNLQINSNDIYTIDWGDATINELTQHTYNSVGVFNIFAVAKNEFNCLDTSSIQTEVFAHPISNFSLSSESICLNQQPVLLNTNTQFNNLNNVQQSLYINELKHIEKTNNFSENITFDEPNTYLLKLTSQTDKGCKDSIEKTIEIKPLPNFHVDFNKTICFGDELPINLKWQNNEINEFKTFLNGNNIILNVENSSNNDVLKLNPTAINTYNTSIVAVGKNACEQTKNITFEVAALPIADFSFRKTETKENAIVFQMNNQSQRVNEYNWQFNLNGIWQTNTEKEPQIEFNDTGKAKAYLFVKDQNGCEDSISKMMLVYPSFVFFFPEAISANNDGLNETFKVSSPYFIKNYHLEIFNRWGQKIFETKNPNHIWQPEFEGVYIYRAKVQDLDNKIKNHTGTITVLK